MIQRMASADSSDGKFVREAAGPPGLFGVFEDDGETGYLYLYEPGGREVFHHLHIYDRTPHLSVREEDVRVVWSENLSKVGVQIWGAMRGIINVATGQEGRVWLESRDTPGIDDEEWLSGFR
jgi:hypothetical protein